MDDLNMNNIFERIYNYSNRDDFYYSQWKSVKIKNKSPYGRSTIGDKIHIIVNNVRSDFKVGSVDSLLLPEEVEEIKNILRRASDRDKKNISGDLNIRKYIRDKNINEVLKDE